jgi:hypothetical protein
MIGRIKDWLRPQPEPDRDADAAIAEGMADLRAAAVKLGIASFEAGVAQERQRIEAILRLPLAGAVPERALALALLESVTPEQAAETLAAEAQRAALAQLESAESSAWIGTLH